jgi:hypothetical protein
MKKSVRNIVSLVTSTCLVASLGTFSINADEEVVEEVASNDTVVEQNSSNEAVVSSAVTKSASTNDTAKEVVASTAAAATNNNTAVDTVAATAAETVKSYNAENDDATIVTDANIELTVAASASSDDSATTDVSSASSETGEVTEGDITVAAGTTSASYSSQSTTAVASNNSTSTNSAPGNVIAPASTDSAAVTTVAIDSTASVTEAVTETVVATTKDVILTLDTSSSMDGEPKELVRKTATELVNKILSNDSDTRIALVGFNDAAYHIYQYDEENDDYVTYFDNAEDLINAINDILDATVDLDDDSLSGSGGTNLLNALYQVEFLLETSDGVEKSVVIMTDGQTGSTITDEDGNVLYDVPDKYVFGEDFEEDFSNMILDFADETIKPLATIYTVGFFQNLADEDEVATSSQFLQALASDGEDGAKYYEANEKNVDEITDLITQDIVHHAINETATNNSNNNNNSTSTKKSTATIGTSDSSDSPNTSDSGVAPIVMVSAIASAMLLLTRKNRK